MDHMVTMARSTSISGPYESNPANPVLTNANTTSYCTRGYSLLHFLRRMLTISQSRLSAMPICSRTATETGESDQRWQGQV